MFIHDRTNEWFYCTSCTQRSRLLLIVTHNQLIDYIKNTFKLWLKVALHHHLWHNRQIALLVAKNNSYMLLRSFSQLAWPASSLWVGGMLTCRTDRAFRNACRGKLTNTFSQAVNMQSKVQELFCARSASVCSFINGARPSSHVTSPIIDLTKSKQHPGLRKLKHNIVFCNKSSAMSFFPPLSDN